MDNEHAGKHDRESIYRVLREQISLGELEPGMSLREVELSERFGVSRTPVRDALLRLEESRLLERTSRGLEVKGIDPQTTVQVYDLRILLEEEVSGQAAENHTINDILKLEALLERDRKICDPTHQELVQSNLEFHRAVWEASHNPVLLDLLERLRTPLVHAPEPTLSVDGRWEEALEEHAGLIRAIEKRDRDVARAAARKHLEKARAIRMELLRKMVARESIRSL